MRDPNLQTLLALNLALIMQLAGVSLAVFIDPYIKKENRRRLTVIVIIIAYLLIEPQISNHFGDILYANNIALWYTFLSVLSYIMRTLALYLFIRLSRNDY